MVRGLEIFREHFADYTEQYVLIGGTACTLALEAVGIDFRATKDLDIVLCIEALSKQFVKAFWDFIRIGEYKKSSVVIETRSVTVLLILRMIASRL